MVRGFAVCGCPSALRKKRFAAALSRLAESRKSTLRLRRNFAPEPLRLIPTALKADSPVTSDGLAV
jgi:hypothetical protein